MFGIKAGYVTRAVPAYTADDDAGGFQPHVYTLAGTLAALAGARRIVDIGCGRATKLAALHPRFEIVGLDYGENLHVAQQRYQFGTWLEIDLESVDAGCLDASDAVIICSDVIEHLQDPSCLIAALRVWMKQAVVGLLSTPERVLCYGSDHNGPPPNPSHTREWTRVELEQYLTQSGLSVAFSGFTQTHIAHPETGAHQGCQTTLLILEGEK